MEKLNKMFMSEISKYKAVLKENNVFSESDNYSNVNNLPANKTKFGSFDDNLNKGDFKKKAMVTHIEEAKNDKNLQKNSNTNENNQAQNQLNLPENNKTPDLKKSRDEKLRAKLKNSSENKEEEKIEIEMEVEASEDIESFRVEFDNDENNLLKSDDDEDDDEDEIPPIGSSYKEDNKMRTSDNKMYSSVKTNIDPSVLTNKDSPSLNSKVSFNVIVNWGEEWKLCKGDAYPESIAALEGELDIPASEFDDLLTKEEKIELNNLIKSEKANDFTLFEINI